VLNHFFSSFLLFFCLLSCSFFCLLFFYSSFLLFFLFFFSSILLCFFFTGKLTIALRALRDIKPGDELTQDYNCVTESPEEFQAAVCLCGHHNCRGSFLYCTAATEYMGVIHRDHRVLHRMVRRHGGGTCTFTRLHVYTFIRLLVYSSTRLLVSTRLLALTLFAVPSQAMILQAGWPYEMLSLKQHQVVVPDKKEKGGKGKGKGKGKGNKEQDAKKQEQPKERGGRKILPEGWSVIVVHRKKVGACVDHLLVVVVVGGGGGGGVVVVVAVG
jgi:hypothetical protein